MAWRDLFRWGRKSADTLELFREIYGRMWSTKSGRTVNLDTAIQVSTVFACARVIGNGMAQVPLKLMRRTGDTRLPATDHPLYDVLALRPNSWQTSFEFRQLMSWHIELCGNFYAFKNAPAGVVRELLPLDPTKVKVTRRKDLSLAYELTLDDGKTQPLDAEDVWHVRGPSWNSWQGLYALNAAREAVGLAIATEESQASLHRNGVQSTGAWSVDGKLSDLQQKQLVDWLVREHVGPDNAGKPFVMDRAAKWVNTQMTGVDAQHLETRRNQIEEICRFFGVMPIMAGYSDKAATYASAEAMFLAHMMHCLSPRWTSYEQSMDANLLTERDRRDGLYFDFVEEGMIRGSVRDTKDAILGYVNGGILTPNEGRALLDKNPDADPASNKLRIPVNTVNDPRKEKPDEGEPIPA